MTDQQLLKVSREAGIAQKQPVILCVDDETYNLDIMERHLKKAGYQPILVENGREALELLSGPNHGIDLVLLDRMMPQIDGMEVLKHMKAHKELRDIPVILQTAKTAEEDAVEGIQAGAYYYVTKPYAADMLLSVVNAALREKRESHNIVFALQRSTLAQSLMIRANFEYRTLDEARELATYLSNFSGDPNRVIVSLTALMSNAVEHGNLGIGYEKKMELLRQSNQTWEDEIKKRLELPDSARKKVRVTLERLDTTVRIRILDEGEGFDWKQYMDFDPSRMTDPNGRGIAMANVNGAGKVEYQGNGSEVIYVTSTLTPEELELEG